MWRWALACGGAGMILVGVVVALRPAELPPDRRPRVRVAAVDLRVTVPVEGTVEAAPLVAIEAPSGGRLTRWLAGEGDQVVQGQPLALMEVPGVSLFGESPPAIPSSGLKPLPVGPGMGEVSDPAIVRAEARVERLRGEVAEAPMVSTAGAEARRASLLTAQEERRRTIETTQPAEQAEVAAALATAKSDLVDVQSEYDRQVELERQGVVTARSVQSAKLAIGVAQDRVTSAQSSFDGLARKFAAEISKLDATIRRRLAEFDRVRGDDPARVMKREELRNAEAELARLRRSASRAAPSIVVAPPPFSPSPSARRAPATTAEIRATASGVLIRRAVGAGEVIRKDAPVATLQNRARWIVRFHPLRDAPRLRPGSPVRISSSGGDGEPLRGQVVRVSGTEAVVSVLSPQGGLRAGSKVHGEVQVAFQKGAISLPRAAVRWEGDNFYVDRPDGRGSRRVSVGVGLTDGVRVEILSGLRVGDEVLE